MRLIQRFPILVLAGGGLLGYIAGEMVVEDPAIAPWIARKCRASTSGSRRSSASSIVVVGRHGLIRRRGTSEA